MSTAMAAAEVSKVPFFIAGGVLAVWAVILSAIGLTRPDFPTSNSGARLVMLVSAVFVAAAMTAAVATS